MANTAAGQQPIAGQALSDSLFPILQHPNANKLNAKLSNVPNSLPTEKVHYADMLKDPKPQQPNECFWLARERGRKTKTTKLIADGIGSTWVQLERVNPSPSPTHSARDSEWAKAEAILNAATRCSRETELIRAGSASGFEDGSTSGSGSASTSGSGSGFATCSGSQAKATLFDEASSSEEILIP
uniref:Integrase core domain containing protein n=1 Tax=Solanum tuberosum TaxID=4113 RepID=M1CNU6_SOLTU